MTGIPKRCPRCGSPSLKDIVYGTPEDPELLNLWARGQVMIRPHRTTDGASPGWMCAECGLETSDTKLVRALPTNR
ncbi:hypothetical protein BH18ACT17_BH18ACT17_09430 [soil metagenome]